MANTRNILGFATILTGKVGRKSSRRRNRGLRCCCSVDGSVWRRGGGGTSATLRRRGKIIGATRITLRLVGSSHSEARLAKGRSPNGAGKVCAAVETGLTGGNHLELRAVSAI